MTNHTKKALENDFAKEKTAIQEIVKDTGSISRGALQVIFNQVLASQKALEETDDVLHIEIGRSFYKKDGFFYREGDVRGSTEISNLTKKELLKQISESIDNLPEEKNAK